MGEMCSMCGKVADALEDGDPPVAWCADIVETRSGPQKKWICTTCTRSYVRSIEAKLDQTYW
jgi:hypothetical protein